MNENKTLVVVAGKRRYARRSERAEVVAACEASGLSVAAFAAQRGLLTVTHYEVGCKR